MRLKFLWATDEPAIHAGGICRGLHRSQLLHVFKVTAVTAAAPDSAHPTAAG
jgi:hypothetical protein